MSTAFIGLGANLGDRAGTLRWALERLDSVGKVTAVSPIYETEPLDYLDQPPFLNAVAKVTTNLRPGSVLASLLAIELDGGRERSIRHGPRTLDLDLLLYDDLVMATPDLTLPHPRMLQRAFVLVPLADLAPDLVIPGTDETVTEMLGRLESLSGVHPYEPDADRSDGQRPVSP